MTKKLITLLLIITLLLPTGGAVASTAQTLQQYQREPDLLFYIDAFQYVKERYPFEIEESQLIESSLKGMLQSVDPYSDYYTSEEADEMYGDLLGEFSGIGIYIEEKNSYINIVEPIANSPGQEAGLKANDLIVSIDDIDVKGYSSDAAKDLIRGQKGTKVKLGILRGNKTTPIYIEVIREDIEINPVEYRIIDKKIGYIKLIQFTDNAEKEIKNALESFDQENIDKLILDLRNNPGGLLTQAIDISRLFVLKGPVVHIKEKDKDLVTYVSTNEKLKYDLVLLVNENSASASEIVAGAIKDTKAGTIIGNKTYGKGIVQSMLPLANGGVLKLTTAQYLTPNKISIHNQGITPDLQIQNTNNQDLQLKKAVEILSQ